MNKYIFTFLIVLFSVLDNCYGQLDLTPSYRKDFDIKGFKPIPTKNRESFIDKINPTGQYLYWECVWRNIFSKDQNRGNITVFNGDSSKYASIAHKIICNDGFFYECEPLMCFSYIIGVKGDNKVDIINSEEKLKTFIGKIDNIEEAVLISKINGFWYDPDTLIGGAFKERDLDYLLYLLDYSSTPVTFKSVKAVLTKDGDFKVLSKKIYKQTNDWIQY